MSLQLQYPRPCIHIDLVNSESESEGEDEGDAMTGVSDSFNETPYNYGGFSSYQHWEDELYQGLDINNDNNMAIKEEHMSDASSEDEESSSYEDDDDEDYIDTDAKGHSGQRVQQHTERNMPAPAVFVRLVGTFVAEYNAAVVKHDTRPEHERGSEAAFLKKFQDTLTLYIGNASAWIHSERARSSWEELARKAQTIDGFSLVVTTLVQAMQRDYFVDDYHQMSANFDGIDTTINRFGF